MFRKGEMSLAALQYLPLSELCTATVQKFIKVTVHGAMKGGHINLSHHFRVAQNNRIYRRKRVNH
jgi:hypothetical protein